MPIRWLPAVRTAPAAGRPGRLRARRRRARTGAPRPARWRAASRRAPGTGRRSARGSRLPPGTRRTRCARASKSATASPSSSTSSPSTTTTCSNGTSSRLRLVASTLTPAHAASTRSTTGGMPAIRCSQLSRTISARRPRSASISASSTGDPPSRSHRAGRLPPRRPGPDRRQGRDRRTTLRRGTRRDVAADGDGQPGLAHPAPAEDGDQAELLHRVGDRLPFRDPADEGGEWARQRGRRPGRTAPARRATHGDQQAGVLVEDAASPAR